MIVGLGNPGPEYAATRHNLGFRVVDTLAAAAGAAVNRKQHRALVGTAVIGRGKVVLAKPQTYMNASGQAVGPLVAWYKIAPEDLLVVLDDFDLAPGCLRLRPGGGPGGHKGLASVIEALGTDRFARLRVGIGKPPAVMEGADWALGTFGPAESGEVDAAVKLAAAAAAEFVTGGLTRAMNLYNGKGRGCGRTTDCAVTNGVIK